MLSFFERSVYRRAAMLAIDAGLIAVAYCGAFALRFDGKIPLDELALVQDTLPWVVVIQMTLYFGLHLNQVIWRYVSLGDVVKIAVAAAIGMIVFALANGLYLNISGFPRSIYALDLLIQISFLSGSRALRRIAYDFKGIGGGKRILIFGAGDAGEMIVRDMKYNPYYGYSPIGFIDDDPLKTGRRIHGTRVLGTRADLPRVMAKESPDEVLVAMPQIEPATLRGILKTLEAYPVPLKTLPNIRDILNGGVSVASIRNVALADLLGRAPAGLDIERVRSCVAGRRVMVTGAGGSIGSELCRQLWSLEPEALVMYERHENSLYVIEKELRDQGANPASDSALIALVGDVCDESRVDWTLNAYGIEVIFHAAAHKHVPLMELNPCEAIKNNVRGTRTMAEVAAQNGVERFILVSTDKAVNPSSVMGASKRIAEMLVQDLVRRTGLKFAAVRFGNVLGSNGSVVPRFLEQIHRGGPVTVTHPEIRRFFMLIPEAVQLVLHASTIAEPGAIYVLEMGEQVKIVDMARHMIRLAGFVPDSDIKVEFTGLRPGEKLFEELVAEGEELEASSINGIKRLRRSCDADSCDLAKEVQVLEHLAITGQQLAMIDRMRRIVPSFRYSTTDELQSKHLTAASCADGSVTPLTLENAAPLGNADSSRAVDPAIGSLGAPSIFNILSNRKLVSIKKTAG